MFDFFNTFDMNLMIWIHQNLSNTIFDKLMPFITDKKNWIVPIASLIIILCFFSGKKGKITLFILIISLSVTDAVCAQILKPFFERLRPSHLHLEQLNLLVSRGGKWSMPSNHAANMFSLAVILSHFYPKYRGFLFFFAATISFSRVYVGVHFPGDLIVGALIGYAISLSCLSFWGGLKLHEIRKGKKWVHF